MNSLKLDSDIQSRQIPSVSECINKESDKIEAAVCRLMNYSEINETLTALCDSIEQQYLVEDATIWRTFTCISGHI